MKYIVVVLLALISNDPREIAKVNALKRAAEEAFLAGNYDQAISNYITLADSMSIDEDEIKLNLAHAYYNLKDTASAKSHYNNLSSSDNNKLKSVAYQQLGVMNKDRGKLEEALQQLKSSIKADPTNQEARYNYEVVKKLLEEQQKQEQEQQNQDEENQEGEDENQENQGNQDQENQDQENQDQEGEQQESEEEQEGEETKRRRRTGTRSGKVQRGNDQGEVKGDEHQ
jgi:tetratricopeptide (TPR) repeat protein